MRQSSRIVRLLKKGGEYNGELWSGVAEDSSWNQVWSTSFIDLNFQKLFLDALCRKFYIRLTLARGGRGWGAREALVVSCWDILLRTHCHRYREVKGSNPVEVLNFFQASLRKCINCVHCDDHFFIFTLSYCSRKASALALSEEHTWLLVTKAHNLCQ